MPHLSEKVQIELYCVLGLSSDDLQFRDQVRDEVQNDQLVVLYTARTHDLQTQLEELATRLHDTNDPTVQSEYEFKRLCKIRLAAVIDAAHAELYPS